MHSKFNFYYQIQPSILALISTTLRTSLWESSGLTFGLGALRHLKNFVPTYWECRGICDGWSTDSSAMADLGGITFCFILSIFKINHIYHNMFPFFFSSLWWDWSIIFFLLLSSSGNLKVLLQSSVFLVINFLFLNTNIPFCISQLIQQI